MNEWTDEGPLYFKESNCSLQLLLIQETQTKNKDFAARRFKTFSVIDGFFLVFAVTLRAKK